MKPLPSLAIGIALLSGVWLYGQHTGAAREREHAARQLADTIASTARHVKDSIHIAGRDSIVADSLAEVKRARDESAKLSRVVAKTNAAIASADTAVKNARAVLADSLATLAQVRTSLVESADAIDSLQVQIVAERIAHRGRFESDSIAHAKTITLLKSTHATELRAWDDYDTKAQQAMTAAVASAKGDGLRIGRYQGAGAVTAAAVVVAWVFR